MVKAFIDGQAGTTGLGIRQRLLQHPAVELLEIDPLLRKDDAARKAMFQAADIAFLCLPDQAAREAAILAADCRVRLLDASTAHRTARAGPMGSLNWRRPCGPPSQPGTGSPCRAAMPAA